MKKHLESFYDESRLKLAGADAHHELTMNAAELDERDLSFAHELLTLVESRWTDLDRLRRMSVVLADTASEARQKTLQSDLAVLIGTDVELTDTLKLRISLLEKLCQSWTELSTQCIELRTLLAVKNRTLQQTMLDTGLTPDQQYAVVKVRTIFFLVIGSAVNAW